MNYSAILPWGTTPYRVISLYQTIPESVYLLGFCVYQIQLGSWKKHETIKRQNPSGLKTTDENPRAKNTKLGWEHSSYRKKNWFSEK